VDHLLTFSYNLLGRWGANFFLPVKCSDRKSLRTIDFKGTVHPQINLDNFGVSGLVLEILAQEMIYKYVYVDTFIKYIFIYIYICVFIYTLL